jgi:hypothetical protein
LFENLGLQNVRISRIDKGGKLNIKTREERKEEGKVKGVIPVIKEIIRPSRYGKVLYCVLLYYFYGNFLIDNILQDFCT